MIDYNEWKTQKRHECANMENYGGNCTARHFRFGTYKISGRWIFVGQSVTFHTLSQDFVKVVL